MRTKCRLGSGFIVGIGIVAALTFLCSAFIFGTSSVAQTNVILDPGFHTGIGFDDEVISIAVQSDGKILVGGLFLNYNGTAANRIIRLNTDGSVDPGFQTGSGFDDAVLSIALQSDGKILAGGAFTTYKGTAENHIIRLNSDGSADSSFNAGDEFTDAVTSIALQRDEKIIVGGYFSSVIRLNTDSSVDPSFQTNSEISAPVLSLAIQEDGKIVVGGFFDEFVGSTVNHIIRLNTDGSTDSSFHSGTGFDSSVQTVNLQSDGRILLGGSFSSYNGISANKIIRLNPDGSVDTTFNTGSGFSGEEDTGVHAILVQFDGKIVVGGEFHSFNGTAANNIIRLNSNGSTDFGFNSGAGMNDIVDALALQCDGKILAGGVFTRFNDTTTHYIARIIAIPPTIGVTTQGNHFLITRSGILSQEVLVSYQIKVRHLDKTGKTIRYTAQTQLKAGQTTQKIRFTGLKRRMAVTGKSLKVALRVLPPQPESIAASKIKMHKQYLIDPAEQRAVLILIAPVLPLPTICSPFIFNSQI